MYVRTDGGKAKKKERGQENAKGKGKVAVGKREEVPRFILFYSHARFGGLGLDPTTNATGGGSLSHSYSSSSSSSSR